VLAEFLSFPRSQNRALGFHRSTGRVAETWATRRKWGDLKYARLNKRKDSIPTLLKSYFDGANKADSTQYKVVTLASISGTKYDWAPFEREWRQTLKRHKAPCLHLTDAISFYNYFTDPARNICNIYRYFPSN